MTIGHIIDRNLSESDTRDKDSRALDNLAGEGISNDISLFINNTNNISIINSTEYIIENGFVVLTNPFIIPFSNRTQVIADNVECIVRNSNFTTKFQLIRKSNNTVFTPTGNISRKDTIFLKNFELLNIDRIPPTKTDSANAIAGLLRPRGATDDNNLNIFDTLNISSAISRIDDSISVYRFRKSNSIQLDRNNTFDERIRIGGTILLEFLDSNKNPITMLNSISENDPGIFLTNNGNKIRAFSDSTNPWDTEINSGFNTTQSIKTTVVGLKITNPSITGLSVENNTGNINQATHKIPIIINGEIYNMLAVLS